MRPPTHEHICGEAVKGTQHCTVGGCAALHHECTLVRESRNGRSLVLCQDCGSSYPGFRLPGDPVPETLETDLERFNRRSWRPDQVSARDRRRNKEFYRGHTPADSDGETVTRRSTRARAQTWSDQTLPSVHENEEEGATRSRGWSM